MSNVFKATIENKTTETTQLKKLTTGNNVFIVVKCQMLAAWCSGYSVVRRMNEVTVHWARLVLGWVTVFGRVYHHGV